MEVSRRPQNRQCWEPSVYTFQGVLSWVLSPVDWTPISDGRRLCVLMEYVFRFWFEQDPVSEPETSVLCKVQHMIYKSASADWLLEGCTSAEKNGLVHTPQRRRWIILNRWGGKQKRSSISWQQGLESFTFPAVFPSMPLQVKPGGTQSCSDQ